MANEELLGKVIEEMARRDFKVDVEEISRNGVSFHAFIYKRPEVNTAPVMYFEDVYGFYKDILDGEEPTVDQIVVTMITRLKEASVNQPVFDIDAFFDNLSTDQLRIGIAGKGNCGTDLTKQFLDMEMFMYVTPIQGDDYSGTMRVSKEMLQSSALADRSYDELFEAAISNSNKDTEILSMKDMMVSLISMAEFKQMVAAGLVEPNLFDALEDGVITMYVASNSYRSGGAAAMLNDEALKNFAEEYGDFYILPSSLDEIIFVPKGGIEDKSKDDLTPEEALNKMVREVNESGVVDVRKILTNNVYYYSLEDETISICERMV